jgi:hypothetical protein
MEAVVLLANSGVCVWGEGLRKFEDCIVDFLDLDLDQGEFPCEVVDDMAVGFSDTNETYDVCLRLMSLLDELSLILLDHKFEIPNLVLDVDIRR